MKYTVLLIFNIFFSSISRTQTLVTSTNVSKTVEYSYDADGRLIKNFSLFKKVIPDSVENIIQGKWRINEYESWEKESVDSIVTILSFDNDTISIIQGRILSHTISLKGVFKIMSNNAEGAEIIITNIECHPNYFYKIDLHILHCEKNILFVSIMTFDSKTSNSYNGMYKLVRIE
jgi:hypothetical protein